MSIASACCLVFSLARRMAPWLAAPLVASTLGLCSPARADTPLSFGAIVPQSWPSTVQGEDIVRGMELALKTWPGEPVRKLIIKDSACDARRAEAAARELLAAKVDLVLGSWCVIGSVPKIVADAGVTYVSANAERIAKAQERVLQLGRVEVYAAERIATTLREDTGLRISARTSCWIDFEPLLFDKYNGVLCPVLNVDRARWSVAEATYTAAYRKPFTYSAARGYAAMEAALAQMRRLRSPAKLPAEPILTILGPVPAADALTQPDAMQLVMSPRLPQLSPREQTAWSLLQRTKGCGCGPGSACAKEGKWAELPFVLRGMSAACPVLAAVTGR